MTDNRRTHIVRITAPAVMFLATLFVAIFMFVPPAHAYDDQELVFLQLINNYRAQNGLPILTLSNSLTTASFWHSADMANHNFFSHTGSDGSSPFTRMRAAGYYYNTWLGENIVAGYNQNGPFNAQDAFDTWRNSPEHNANMLSPNYRAIGISRVYNGASTYHEYWTTDFGGVSEDNTPPSVSILYPSGSKVSGKAAFGVNAWDNVGIMQVVLYVDGAVVAGPQSPPYSCIWDTTGLANGSQHTLTATAYDSAGLTASTSTQVTVDNFTPTKRYYFTWYDQQSPGLMDWVLMANPPTGLGTARVSALVGANTFADRDIAAGAAAQTPWFPGVMGGPVTVQTTRPLIASQRTVYKDSFNETPAVSDTALATTYYFTWYDSKPANGMVGDWILISNMGSSNANVEVDIGGINKGTYVVAPGGSATPTFPNTVDGPVKVTSLNAQPLIVSQRVIYRDSFSEVLGVPVGNLTTDYTFPWYDCTGDTAGNWILIGNQDTGDATVDVYIGGKKMHDPANPGNDYFTVPQGGRVTPMFPGEIGGPVTVTSTNGKKLIVSQRVLYKSSFEEIQGLTAADAGTDLWFTLYDSLPADHMGGNWIMVTNSGAIDANVDIYINGTLKGQATIPAGGNRPLSYPNTFGGPVRVVSTNGQPLYVTQRVVYKNSFNEIGGIKFTP